MNYRNSSLSELKKIGSEINIFLTHYGFPMNINGLGLDFQSFFQEYSSQSLTKLNLFLERNPMNPQKSWSSLIWLVSTFCLLAFTSLSAATLKVGLVTDVGRVNDRSFNQSAWEGVQEAKKQLGLNDRHVKYIETQDAKDYADNLAQFLDAEYNVIVLSLIHI